jgi:UDP-glucose 4-epimerase
MSSEEAIDNIFLAATEGKDGETIIKKMKSAKISNVINSFLRAMGEEQNYPIKKIGVRPGEKMHEHLITEEELFRVKENNGYFTLSPYGPVDLRKNILTEQDRGLKMSKFSSESKENYMSDKELKNYVEDFVDNARSSLEFI